ncbi:hypothetical protein HZC32_01190 [Candidatus Woesearchaeota archaeon]|nr:hypothetical protein [Candidatus Woesearchaeota archaeon]
MKQKICISIDTETLFQIKERVREGTFRNKSHAIEFAVNKILKGGQKND